MIGRLALILALFSLTFLSAVLPLGAQSATPGGQSGVASPPLQVLVTGCLKRSHNGGYYLTDRNGTHWRLSSSKVNLGDQVLHEVTVTGKPAALAIPNQTASQENDSSQAGGKPSPSLQVLTLKMLSDSCSQ